MSTHDPIQVLADAIAARPKVFVLSGAGCSTESGIPDYRDAQGRWKRTPPVQLRDFLTQPRARQRYWARSLVAWPAFSAARPGPAHRALAGLERAGFVTTVVTQNVDGLHQRAGSERVIDLHGRNDEVVCIGCGQRTHRDTFQGELNRMNPGFAGLEAPLGPDGDADLEGADFDAFEVPSCACCGGIIRPDVVFFGDAVPRDRVARAHAALDAADGLLAVGTSLMVYSGFRFCRAAQESGKPLWIINGGKTRADELPHLKIRERTGRALGRLLTLLDGGGG